MRIRRNPSRILELSSSSSSATVQVEPKAASLSEEPVLPPPVPTPPALHVDDTVDDVADALVLLSTPTTEELTDDDDLVGDVWREPRENPGLSYTSVKFLPQQDEEETESETEVEEEEEIFLVKREKVEDKIGKQQEEEEKEEEEEQQQQQDEEEKVNEKLKRDENQQKKGSKSKTMKAKVITAADEAPRCKKTDGRKWTCRSSAALPHTLCEKHLARSRAYYSSIKEAAGEGSSKSAPWKASTGSGVAAPAKASSSGSKRAQARSPPSSTEAALARAKAAPAAAVGARPSSKRPLKKMKEDVYYSSGGAFYYPEPFGPFRAKQHGHYSRPTAIVVEEGETSTQEDGGSASEAPEEGLFPEENLSSKATRKPSKIRTLDSLHLLLH